MPVISALAAMATAVALAFGVAAIASLDEETPASFEITPTPAVQPLGDAALVVEVDDGLVVRDGVAGARDGAELFVWRADRPALPLALLRVEGEWIVVDDPWDASPTLKLDGDELIVAVDAPSLAASAGSIRQPASGHVGDQSGASGAAEAAVLDAIADAQRGYGGLDPLQRELVSSLLARQSVSGAYTYRVRGADGSEATAVVSVALPRLSQLGSTGAGLFVAGDVVLTCDDATLGSTCHESSAARTPAGVAAAVAAEPMGVAVDELPDGTWNEQPTRCVQVASSIVGGPGSGRWC